MDAKPAINADRDIKPCMACFAPNDVDAEICVECGARFGESNVLQPLNVARAEGQIYQKLALGDKRPRLPVLIGVWVMFLPLLIIGIAIVTAQILDLQGFTSFVFICIGGGAIYLSILMLWRITTRYFKRDHP